MDLELRHLRVVCAIAEAGSVTKAASVLGLAQPALTAQLQRIERTLGGPLFERDRRGARPTPLGQLVLDRARVLLPAVKGLQDEAAKLAGATARTVSRYRIGTINGPLGGGLVHRLSAEDPGAKVTLHHSLDSHELADSVVSGRLDIMLTGACGDSAPSAHPLVWQTIAVDPVFVMLPERHELAGAEEVELSQLADNYWVASPGDHSCFESCFVAACSRAGFAPKAIYETDVRSGLDLVESGDAVALCQATFRPIAGLVTLPIAGTPLRWRQVLGWDPESGIADAAGRVAKHATAAYRDAVDRNARYAAWLRRHPRFGAQALAAA